MHLRHHLHGAETRTAGRLGWLQFRSSHRKRIMFCISGHSSTDLMLKASPMVFRRGLCTALRHTLLPSLILTTVSPAVARGATAPGKAVVAYVFVKDRALTPAEVDARKLTRINYAFANLQNGEVVEGFSHDAENFAVLRSLKQQNPVLSVLVSVGGWTWSGNFSDAALTRASRARFIDSAVRFVEKYQLDRLDIDWEYPGLSGDNNKFRPEDKANYTALLHELRTRFNKEGKRLHRHLVTSIATGANSDFLAHTEMGKVAHDVDTVNLMTYDFYGPGGDKITGNHAPLYTDPADPKGISADRSVREYEAAGVPAAKIVLGLPFYGKSWSNVGGENHGLFQPGDAPSEGFHGYNSLVGLEKQGYTRYWDGTASVPWLYNPDSKTFISYEDPQSLALKCSYVLEHRLGGVMFWELSEDSNGQLLSTIDLALHPGTTTATALEESGRGHSR